MDDAEKEKVRFFNFLKRYDLDRYYDNFIKVGVCKISHLKDVDENDLKEIGLHKPERNRLKKKLEENFSVMGKFKRKIAGTSKKFDDETTGGNYHTPQRSTSGAKGPVVLNPENIKLGKKLGEGVYGAVHEAMLLNEDGTITVAVKSIFTHEKGPSVETMFIKEAQSMVQLHHQHIIKLFGLVLGNPLMLVEEIAPLGNLLSYLKTHPVNVGTMYTYAVQIADAMQYLESMKIIHRDLAARNILLLNEKHVKLSDFGLARKLKEGSTYNLTNFDTPLPTSWLAPESLSEGKFSSASDVWSYGVLLWEITSLGARPWDGFKPMEVYHKIEFGERLSRPRYCYQMLYEVMTQCWEAAPENRPTFNQIHTTLQKSQYAPETVLVTRKHTSDMNVVLNEGDILYVVEKLQGEWCVGMDDSGNIISFMKKYVMFEPNKTRLTSPPPLISNKSTSSPKEDHTERYAVRTQQLSSDCQVEVEIQANNNKENGGPKNKEYMRLISENSCPAPTKHGLHDDPSPHNLAPPPPLCASSPDGPPKSQDSTGQSLEFFSMQPTSGYVTMRPASTVINSPDEIPSHLPLNDPPVRQESSSSIIDSPPSFDVNDLPAPILPTANALHQALYNKPLSSPLTKFDPLNSSAPPTNTVPDDDPVTPTTPPVSPLIHAVPTSKSDQPSLSDQVFQLDEIVAEYSVLSLDDNKISETTGSPIPPQFNIPTLSADNPLSPTHSDDAEKPPIPPRLKKRDTDSNAAQPIDTKPTLAKSQTIVVQPTNIIDTLRLEFPDVTLGALNAAVQNSQGNIEKARGEVKVHQLMGFGLPYIHEEDCRRALTHCQGKMDRAAAWLLEQSETISNRSKP